MFRVLKEIGDYNWDSLKNIKWAFVDFWASWCGPCMAMSPIVDELEKDFPDVEFYKCDLDGNYETGKKLDIQKIPQFFMFKNGVQVSKMMGGGPKEKLKEYIVGTLKMNDATA